MNSTELGAYFVNYHSKEPQIYADMNASYAGFNPNLICGAASGGASCAQLQTAAGLGDPGAALALQASGAVAAIDVANQVNAKREYVEDIRMYGLSFNTTIDETSVFGELAYRPNLPIGIETTNDLLGDLLGQALSFGAGGLANIGGQLVTRADQIHNYERVEAINTSFGAIHNFGTALSFDSLFGVAELASEHLRGSDLQYTDYNGNVRYYAGRANRSYVGEDPGVRDDQVNKNAYGYTLLLSGTWNDVYAGVNLSPFVVYKDDFEGNSHQTGNFIEDRKAYTVGLRASYMSSLEAELQYTEFMGGGESNSGRDRDNVGLNVKYSF